MHWQFLLGTSAMAMSLLCNRSEFLLDISAMATKLSATTPPWGVQSFFLRFKCFLFSSFLFWGFWGFLVLWKAGKTKKQDLTCCNYFFLGFAKLVWVCGFIRKP
jgi:hypothetical protein